MARTSIRILVAIAALALFAAACNSSEPADTTTTTLAPTTTAETTTTTTAPPTTTTTTIAETTTTMPPAAAPTVNGLEADEALMDRRLVAIKIDNHNSARPQSGLQTADAVYEILVEGGLTRFIAIFHQSDDTYVGPNRSGRPTDAEIIRPLGGPFVISGAQQWVQRIFTSKDVETIYETRATSFRIGSRRAPHNLYVDTERVREYADEQGWPDEPPPPLYVYSSEPVPTTGTAERIELDWSNHPNVVWTWEDGTYKRANGETAHEWVDQDGEFGRVEFDTLVVIKARRYVAEGPGGEGSAGAPLETVGSGEAIVFSDGGFIEGTWERESDEEVIRLFAEDGAEIVLPPGRVWTSIFPNTRTVVWE